jgi:predicted ATPase/GAF domain-containing protein/tRNA A-37 threonylcarbamoyl transferase component Bud32
VKVEPTEKNTTTLALDGYTDIREIHEGEETAVYRAKSIDRGASVIIKATKDEYPSAKELARLRRELSILRDLDLPTIPKAYALEPNGRGLALVMEDFGFGTLRDLLDQRRLDVGAALTLAISITGVLAEVHRRRIIHKDITPRNIVVDESTLKAYLIDFGISARLAREAQALGAVSALEGTLSYIAPEQTGRMNRVVDLRADLYSLGVVLYEMLTGVVPFASESAAELVHSHIARRPIPPHERAPDVPAPLSEIVMTLLAKRPEDRYQSDAGLRADLVACARQWEQTGRVEPFPLKRHDRVTELRLALHLYGREREIGELMDAFERARSRGPELALISGYSGVGKSALVSEIHKPIAKGGGYFVSGKFDQIASDVPLAPIVQALRELTRHILTEPAEALAVWKQALLAALKNNARVLTDLVPELSLIVGPQPELAALGPVEAKNRFNLALSSFLGVIAAPEHPVVIFLDDLQWIDVASLKLLEMLLSDTHTKHLLLIGAYRDNEVQPGHPLSMMLGGLKKSGLSFTEIRLAPLDEPTVVDFVTDMLASPADEVRPLGAVIFQKTQGNPFFVQQLMDTLHRDGLLQIDPAEGTWRWDLDRIRSGRVTDNVAELMVSRLARLEPATRRMLMLASCVGFRFSLRTLAAISETSLEEAARALWAALEEELVLPLDGDYRLLEPSGERGSLGQLDDDFDVHYRFLHDRVSQAAYGLAGEEEKRQIHLAIGRMLRRRGGAAPRDDELVDIVHHLNRGVAGITGAAERVDLAELNLAVCRKAKASGTYDAAASYAQAGVALLSDESWETHNDLAFALHAELAECEFLNGQVDRAEATYGALLPRAKSDLDRARIHCQRLKMFTVLARYADAIKDGVEGLAVLGQPLSLEGDLNAAFMELLPAITGALAGRSVEELLEAPVVDDPAQELAEEIFANMIDSIYRGMPSAFPVVLLKHMSLFLARGHTRFSAYGYLGYSALLATGMGRYAEAFAFAQLALSLTQRIPNLPMSAYANLTLAMHGPFHRAVRESVRYLDAAFEASLETGDFTKLGTIAGQSPLLLLMAGYPLEEIFEYVDRNLALTRRIRQPRDVAILTAMRQVVLTLMGRTGDQSSSGDGGAKEEDSAAAIEKDGYTQFHIQNLLLRMRYFQGDFEGALAAADAAEENLMYVAGNSQSTEHAFYRAMTLLALPPAGAEEEGARRSQLLRASKQQIEQLARISPRSFEHKRVLMEAEEARVTEDVKSAVALYEQAILLAREDRFTHIEALAMELAGKLYRDLKGTRAAQSHMTRAYRAYLHWGAVAKAAALEEQYPDLLPAHAEEDRAKTASTSTRSSTHARTRTGTILTRTSLGGIREAGLVVRAIQAISGEMNLSKAIERMATLVLENSGAQSGALILARDGQLVVEATFRTDPDEVKLGAGLPLDACDDIAKTVVVYVTRTMESIVLQDATEAGRFSEDPYIREQSPRSMLCLPLLHQARLIGVLYLEHRQTTGLFNAARVELLALLSSQAAMAIENARLFEGVRRAKEDVERANERLEAEVAQRTEELRRANAKLSEANERLERELSQREADVASRTHELRHANEDLSSAKERLERELAQREQIERERAALQEQVIEAQRARLAELSTPLIPITDEVVVMPLIGTLDRDRASQMLAVALEGAQQHRAAVVILDITGIKGLDADVAGTLVGVAGALRLLGTETVVTGIAPRIALSFVELGIDLGSFMTMGTLQSGMSYALRHVGEGRGQNAWRGRRRTT